MKDKIIRYIASLFELEKEEDGDYCKLVRTDNCYSDNYIKYETNCDRR